MFGPRELQPNKVKVVYIKGFATPRARNSTLQRTLMTKSVLEVLSGFYIGERQGLLPSSVKNGSSFNHFSLLIPSIIYV